MTLEISGDHDIGEIVVNSHYLQVPSGLLGICKIDDKVIVLLANRSRGDTDDADIELPELGRNIVAIDGDGEVVWTVSDAPDEKETTDESYYAYIFNLLGDLYARDTEGKLYKINHHTGELIESYKKGHLPIGNKLVSLDGRINKVIEFGGMIFVVAESVYGFDTEGNEVWKSEGLRGMLYKDGDKLLEKRQRGPRTTEFYRLDPETGERLAEVEAESDGWGWTYVRDISKLE